MSRRIGIWAMALSLLAIPASAKAGHDDHGWRTAKRSHERIYHDHQLRRLRVLAADLDGEVQALYRAVVGFRADRGYRARGDRRDARRAVKAIAELREQTRRFHDRLARHRVGRSDARKQLRGIERAFERACDRATGVSPRARVGRRFARIGHLVERLERVSDVRVAWSAPGHRHARVARFRWLFGY